MFIFHFLLDVKQVPNTNSAWVRKSGENVIKVHNDNDFAVRSKSLPRRQNTRNNKIISECNDNTNLMSSPSTSHHHLESSNYCRRVSNASGKDTFCKLRSQMSKHSLECTLDNDSSWLFFFSVVLVVLIIGDF